MPLVGIVMGSKSDTDAVQPALDILKELGVDYEVNTISAIRPRVSYAPARLLIREEDS